MPKPLPCFEGAWLRHVCGGNCRSLAGLCCEGESCAKQKSRSSDLACSQRLPCPVNIITGALGVGKTTTIQSVLSHKPAGEHWVIVINEFGALGIDAALIEGTLDLADGPGKSGRVCNLRS